MEINLLKHSKYDVEKLRENKIFLVSLVDNITDTYEMEKPKVRHYKDITKISIQRGQDPNVVSFEIDGSGEIKFNIRVLSLNDKERFEAMASKENYKVRDFSHSYDVTIKGINKDNFNEFLGDIVFLIEEKSYYPKR